MKIINHTKWRTDQLRKLIQRVAEDELPPAGRRRLHVTIKTSHRDGGYSGYGHYGTQDHPGSIFLGLPPILCREEKWVNCPSCGNGELRTKCEVCYHSGYVRERQPTRLTVMDRPHLAHLVAHEIAHARGMHHRSMAGDPRYSYAPGWEKFHAWANDYPIEQEVPKLKPDRQQRIQAKLDAAAKHAALYQTKLKRTQTLLKKWQRKVRYYQGELKKAAAPKVEP